jgi:hypothetical protein
MGRDFDDFVGGDDLEPEEELRLREVHDLLVQAGPPPDLPPALERLPDEPAEAEILSFPMLPKRRWAAAAVVAAALAVAAFGAGYLLGDRSGSSSSSSSVDAVRVVPMRGVSGALASIRLGKRDRVGNWPMELVVTGLPTQPEGAYYTLYLTRDGKPRVPCGYFRVNKRTTTVRFTVPYKLRKGESWVVTYQPKGVHEPGRVVLTT